MIVLDLTSPQSQWHEAKFWKFPGGEIGLNLNLSPKFYTEVDKDTKIVVDMRVLCANDLMKLVVASEAIWQLGLRNVSLHLPYLPYARQDRSERILTGGVYTGCSPNSLRAVCKIIDNLGYSQIICLDAHSDVAESCFTKTLFTNNYPKYALQDTIDKLRNNYLAANNASTPVKAVLPHLYLVCPDAGAAKKLTKIASLIRPGIKYSIIQCLKQRDPVTGDLSNFRLFTPEKYQGSDGAVAIIIDDICDGGGTFLGIADKLMSEFGFTREQLGLFVSHGIFSKGLESLKSAFSVISTTDSFADLSMEDKSQGIFVFPLDPLQ